MKRKCFRCKSEDHRYADCPRNPRNRLRVVPDLPPEPDPVPEPVPDMDAYWDGTAPDLTAAHAWWDQVTPLPPPAAAWAAPRARREQAPAEIAREMRLRAEAARQVAESRAARGVL